MGNPIKYNASEKRKLMVKIEKQQALQFLARHIAGLPTHHTNHDNYPVVRDARIVQVKAPETDEGFEEFLVFDICHDELPVVEPGDNLNLLHVEHRIKSGLGVRKIEAEPDEKWYAT